MLQNVFANKGYIGETIWNVRKTIQAVMQSKTTKKREIGKPKKRLSDQF
jgi:hypothetical protein